MLRNPGNDRPEICFPFQKPNFLLIRGKSRDTRKSSSLQTCLWVQADPITGEQISVFTQNDKRPEQPSLRGQGFGAVDPPTTSSGPRTRSDLTPKRRRGPKGVSPKDRWDRSNCEERWGGDQPIWPPSARGGGARHKTNKKIQFS